MLENLKKINTEQNIYRRDQAWKEIKQNHLHKHGECYSKKKKQVTQKLTRNKGAQLQNSCSFLTLTQA
jgi:hypothetical protein